MMKNCFFFLEWLTEKQLASISRRDPFLTAIWPSYGQLWDIFEGTAHSSQGGSSTPFLRHPPLDPDCPPPLLKTFVPLPSVLLHPLLRYFRQFPHPHANPSSSNLTNQLSWFKLSKGQIYQFNCCLLSKINFNLLNPFTSRLS